jgi:hypothetical protein
MDSLERVQADIDREMTTDEAKRMKSVQSAILATEELRNLLLDNRSESARRTIADILRHLDEQEGVKPPAVPNKIFTPSDWNKLLDETFDKVRALGRDKGAEYSGDVDRLLNFRRNGRDLDLPMEVVWRVYAAKHWDAIGQYIRDIAAGKERLRTEPMTGRADDLIVYLLLLKAMMIERGQA